MSIQYTRPSWDSTRIVMAQALATRSLCSRDRVGAIIVDKDNKIIGEGYNGPPAGFSRNPNRLGNTWLGFEAEQSIPCTAWCQRADKMGGDAEPLEPDYSDCPSLHAEANALITSDRSLRVGGTIYVTSHVCFGCAKLVANSGLTRVYVATQRRDRHREPDNSYAFLRKCGLVVEVHGPVMRSHDGS